MKISLRNGWVGRSPHVPKGVIIFHPETLRLIKFFKEGDVVEVNGREYVLLSGRPSFAPRGKEYVGGAFVHGEKVVPPIPIDEKIYLEVAALYKKGEEDLSAYYIPEEYKKYVAPYFGFHIPHILQYIDERGWRAVVEEMGGLPEPIRMTLVERPETGLVETGIHGFYPIKTPWRARVCPEGHVSPLEVCPYCGAPTQPTLVCPVGREPVEDVCPRHGVRGVERLTFDPHDVIKIYEEKYGRVGEVVIVDGPPEDPRAAYFRKKAGITVSPDGKVRLSAPLLPGDKNVLPRTLVDPVLRVYRFLREMGNNEVPATQEDLVGRKLVVESGGRYYYFEVEDIGSFFTLRKELYAALPRKRVFILIPETGVEAGELAPLPMEFEYVPSGVVPPEGDPLRLAEVYAGIVRDVGAQPEGLIYFLSQEILKREREAEPTEVWRCKGCGLQLGRKPLSSCPRCGGEFVRVRERGEVRVDDLMERFGNIPAVYEYLSIVSKRYGRTAQRSILELL